MNPYDRTDPMRRDAWDEGHAAAQIEVAAAQADARARWAHAMPDKYWYAEVRELIAAVDALAAPAVEKPRYEVRAGNHMGEFGVWDTRCDAWKVGRLTLNKAERIAAVLNDAEGA